MELKNLFTDEDAVSPVIGVILMVAITVILAAVIGAFVLGIGGSQETVPSASLSGTTNPDTGTPNTEGYEDGTGSPDWDDKDTYKISHDGGEAIAWSELSIKVTDPTSAGVYGETIDPTDDTTDGDADLYLDGAAKTNDMTAGSSVVIAENDPDLTAAEDADLQLVSGGEVSLVWSSSSSDKSQVLWSSTIP